MVSGGPAWAIVVLIGSYVALTLLYKPRNEKAISRDYIDDQLRALGPMSKNEKITAVIMVIAIVLWILEKQIGIAACTTAVLCLLALAIFGVFTPADLNTKMGWPLLIYVGGILNISTVMGKLGISNWLGNMIAPMLSGLVEQPYVFTIALVLVIYVVRYVMVSFSTLAVLITVVLGPLAQAAGFSPWVVMMIAYTSTTVWVTQYQNANMLVGWAAFGGDEQANFGDVMPGAYAYMLVNLAALLVSIPFWQMMGFFG